MQWIGLPSSTCETEANIASNRVQSGREDFLNAINAIRGRKKMKDTYAQLIGFFWVTNQDCILMIQILSFPKILCKPKLR